MMLILAINENYSIIPFLSIIGKTKSIIGSCQKHLSSVGLGGGGGGGGGKFNPEL